MPYGTVKVDNITFDNGGADQTVTVSGLYRATTSGITVTGTVSGQRIEAVSGVITNISGTNATVTNALIPTANIVSGVFASGTATNPSITFTGDLNTGFYAPSVDQIAITTAGGERVRIQEDGDVGIGTNAPEAKLHILENASTSAVFIRQTGAGNALTVSGSTVCSGTIIATSSVTAASLIPSGATVPSNGLYLPAANSVALSTNTTGRLFINSAGNVGIGTSSPSYRLDVSGQARILNQGSDSALEIGAGTTTSQTAYIDLTTDTTYSDFGLRILRGSAGANADAEIVHRGTGALSITAQEAGALRFQTSATERLRIDSSGNVGIGTSSPSSALHVYGGITGGNPATSGSSDPNVIARFQGGSVAFDIGGTVAGLQWIQPRLFNNYAANYGLAICPNGGSIGIGTTTPGAQLHLYEATAASFRLQQASVTYNSYVDSGNYVCGTITNHPFVFTTNNTERLRIDSSGRVGIGTSSPNTETALDVNGVIRARPVSSDPINSAANIYALNGVGGTLSSLLWRFVTNANDVSAGTERLRIDSSGNVGIGTSAPGASLTIGADGDVWLNSAVNTAEEKNLISWRIEDGSEGARISAFREAVPNAPHSILFGTRTSGGSVTEKARIDSSGRLLVGTSTYSGAGTGFEIQGTGNFGPQIIAYAKGSDIYPAYQLFKKARGTSAVQNNDFIFEIKGEGYDGSNLIGSMSIRGEVDGDPAANDMPGRLVFSTTADGASSSTERLRITSGGYFKASDDGSYYGFASSYHEFRQSRTDNAALFSTTSSTSYASDQYVISCARAGNSAYSFLVAFSDTLSDTEYRLRGDGNAFADGTWTGGGADYAEYFEWFDGNPDADDRRGISVVLDGDKIREALPGEDPIGVISGNPSIVGDAAWNKWSGKYLRDEFGTYILEDYEVTDDDGNTVTQQRRKLNPAYDPDAEYIPREQRPEWDCVGLMGKLRIRKGQVTGTRWIKMRDINDSVEEWLIR